VLLDVDFFVVVVVVVVVVVAKIIYLALETDE
jgi:hypothetical protein